MKKLWSSYFMQTLLGSFYLQALIWLRDNIYTHGMLPTNILCVKLHNTCSEENIGVKKQHALEK